MTPASFLDVWPCQIPGHRQNLVLGKLRLSLLHQFELGIIRCNNLGF